MRISLRRNDAGNGEVGHSALLHCEVFNTYKCRKFIDGRFEKKYSRRLSVIIDYCEDQQDSSLQIRCECCQ